MTLIVIGTVFLMGGDKGEIAVPTENKTEPQEPAKVEQATVKEEIANTEALNNDSLLAILENSDSDALSKIMDNLSFLDFAPGKDDLGESESTLSVEDSLAAVNWLEKENKRLAEKEKELAAREKELNILDKKVTQKILKIEQAESARITSLAKLYDGMDARAVSNLMANLDDATVVSILPRMKQKNASAVLQLMPAQRAARLSKQMITIADN
ncbi:MAG: hypothetical protein PHU88_02145 [candidate division Zixibacteria bacterium]|nr:hypothetical protein [candidate division Zixibacteria bacterium]MDD5425276.1 hypothetical protein [candidate division Zixibacteria bacterium]